MDLDEMLALMTATIYAARMQVVLGDAGMSRAATEVWPRVREEMMEQSLGDAKQIWRMAMKGR